jgi:hypothetical protein
MTGFVALLGFIVMVFWVSAYVSPLGGVPGTWRDSNVRGITSVIQNIANTWDGKHYVEIAKYGYVGEGTGDSNFAFFPGFPMQIRLISNILDIQVETAAILAGFINYIVFCVLLFIFLKNYIKSKNLNLNLELIFLTSLLLPFSVFFIVPYTEGLFMIFLLSLLTLLFFTDYKNKLFYLLPVFGLMISMTRSVGVLVISALVLYPVIKYRLWESTLEKFSGVSFNYYFCGC